MLKHRLLWYCFDFSRPSPSLQPPRPGSSVKRAFGPRSPADLVIGDMVKFSRQGGKISSGEVKYIGHLPGKTDTYLGVELESESKVMPGGSTVSKGVLRPR